MSETKGVKIECDRLGRGGILVQGVEIAARARGFDLKVRAGEVPRLTVYYPCVETCIEAEAALEMRPKEWGDVGTAEMGGDTDENRPA